MILITNIAFFPSPENKGWVLAYDLAFRWDLLASFNQTRLDFGGLKGLYAGFNATIGAHFQGFEHGFLRTVAVPSAGGGKGGFVYLTGWEGGVLDATNSPVWFEDATFAVVEETAGGRRIITEWREASNIPYSRPLPTPSDWSCA